MTTADPAGTRARLVVKPVSERGGSVDGAWWPRSTDPAAEFPGLVAALDVEGGVRAISYHLRTWDRTERVLLLDSGAVTLNGYHNTQPDTVTVLLDDHHRLRLLVVPPPTPAGLANAVLRATATCDRAATVQDILAGNGIVPGTNPGSAPQAPVPEHF
ncbi:DUF5994 family protein [Actinokineospora bangkokensis]|nr:DUF5994 family protein [Actinokineospora bangkokensis]